MGQKISRAVAPALKELQQRFTAWREAGRIGRRIPEELWASATELARQCGVNPISKAIALDYTKLKRRLAKNDRTAKKISPNASGAFVELTANAVAPTSECVIEFEGRCGKLTIRLTGHHPTEVVALAETLAKDER